jgi:hypothetical protein
MTPIDRRPAPLSRWASFLAALVAVGASGLYSYPSLALGVLGLSILSLALWRGSNAGVTTGAFVIFLGALLTGAWAGPVVPTLVSITGAVLAWDFGITAIGVGAQLGREAETGRLEGVHLAASTGVGVASAGIGYGLYSAGTGGQPVAALIFLLLSAVLLLYALG